MECIHDDVRIVGKPMCRVASNEGAEREEGKAIISFKVNFSFGSDSDCDSAEFCKTLVMPAELLGWGWNDADNEYMMTQMLSKLHVPDSQSLSLAVEILAGISQIITVTDSCRGFNATVTINLLVQHRCLCH